MASTITTAFPAKCILFGEHAVVYGEPAIAVPVSALRATVTLDTTSKGFKIIAEDTDEVITAPVDHPLWYAAQMAFEACGSVSLLPSVSLKIRSDIPIASGLGSGAAVSAALIAAILNYCDVNFDLEKLNQLVFSVEKSHHGTPSGIDNTVIVHEKPLYFIKDQQKTLLVVPKPFQVVIANTGIAASTKSVVDAVRALYEESADAREHIKRIGQLTNRAHWLITKPPEDYLEQLGQLMNENHTYLKQLTASSPKLDQLVTVALDAGAYGAKLSGGGRGGNLVALVDPARAESVKQTLLGAEATQAFVTEVR